MSKTTLFKAFPLGNQVSAWQDGMDLRDYFAAKAMTIVLQEFSDQCGEIPYLNKNGEPMTYEEGSSGTWFPHTKEFAKSCYVIADNMMEARYDTK